MRIISGALGGREIKTVAGPGMRPAMGRTREALFSMLEARGIVWEDSRALDLFAGSGSLGIECLSRGSREATFVELSDDALSVLEITLRTLGIAERCRLERKDSLKFLRTDPPSLYDIIFVDPPYRRNLALPVLERAARDWLAPGGFLVAELEPGAEPPDLAGAEKIVSRSFGQTFLHIWRKNEKSSLSGDV